MHLKPLPGELKLLPEPLMFHRWPLQVVSWMTPAWPTPPLRRRALAAVEQTENSYILHSENREEEPI